MFGKNAEVLQALILMVALGTLRCQAQSDGASMASIGLGACGDSGSKFEVKETNVGSQARAQAGKALVFFVEKDINLGVVSTPLSRAGLDGRWVGATHGASYFSFVVEPGIHHLCASTYFGVFGGDYGTAVAHFSAEPGGVYYFEVRNTLPASRESSATDVSLVPLDSDEGKYLTSTLPLVEAHQKK
ncbi:MAG TPA: hypothetical protein VK716_02840 [Terracidiphilus sp.]|jgi:hypothetical protein|nr:hypothetical protein [Terracidiphilus sp.]